MGQKIERDHQCFKKLVRGKVKSNLSKYISRGEMIGKKGKDLVSIPLPQIDVPQFRYGTKGSGGVGQGDGQPGQPLGPPGQDPGSGAGDQPGGHILEVELTMEEMADILGEELALPRIKPQGQEEHRHDARPLHRHSPGRSRIAAPLQAHLQTGHEAADLVGNVRSPKIRVVIPIRSDKQYRSWKEVHQPQSVAVIIYMMDVSGSMTDEQKEIVRIESFWIDTWIKAHYQGVETVYIIHDAAAQEVDEHTFYHTRESGGTKISSAYTLADKIIDTRYSPDAWNVYAFHFSDGDNWGDDIPHCIELLQEKLLPKLNLFGYGQVESPYGSGEFYEYVHEMLGERDNVVCSRIPDREAILGSIKEFLGTGRLKREDAIRDRIGLSRSLKVT